MTPGGEANDVHAPAPLKPGIWPSQINSDGLNLTLSIV